MFLTVLHLHLSIDIWLAKAGHQLSLEHFLPSDLTFSNKQYKIWVFGYDSWMCLSSIRLSTLTQKPTRKHTGIHINTTFICT